jgi:hypothetical protein
MQAFSSHNSVEGAYISSMSSILPIKKDTYDMLKAELFLATPKAAGANADAEATKSKATAAENFMVIYSILKMVPMSGVEDVRTQGIS